MNVCITYRKHYIIIIDQNFYRFVS